MRAHASARESGAALLVFLLVVIVSASSLLLTRLNASVKQAIYSPVSSAALAEARQALMSWAVNHPYNPGTLPMPDRNGDGNYDGDADCFNGVINNNLLIGMLPWRGFPSPCKDAGGLEGLSLYAVDRHGEQLWYAVSKNLVYESPAYPFISPGLLGKTTDWIVVRDRAGNIISDRVAFVLIAPGPSLSPYADCDGLTYSGQDRSGAAPAAGNYLDSVTLGAVTYDNADFDHDFIMYPDSHVTTGSATLEKCDHFNDQLMFVTIDDLMDAVSRRVLNEAANSLTAYHNANGAMPWLNPFADPKSDPRVLSGGASATASNLIDSTADFTAWGVTANDVVWNLTDGSRGNVTAVSATTLSVGAMRFGTNNSFIAGDEYYVEPLGLASVLAGTATSGSGALVLEDTGRNFIDLDIRPGDILDNLTDGSSGVITQVETNRLTLAGLSGGAENDFDAGENYRLRSNTGQATTGSAGQVLVDNTADFVTMGVQAGDLVRNLTDGSFGTVSVAPTANQLTVTALQNGAGNAFAPGQYYVLQRYFPRSTTRSGLLPVYFTGEPYSSSFDFDWTIAGGATITTTTTPAPLAGSGVVDPGYAAGMSNFVSDSADYPAANNVTASDSSCLWISRSVADCRGGFTADLTAVYNGVISGTLTSDRIVDAGEDFPGEGVKRGDKITNLNNSTQGIVRTTYSTNTDYLQISNITGQTAFSKTAGHSYRVDVATARMDGTVTAPTATIRTAYPSVYAMFSSGANFSDVRVGDIIENTTRDGIGRILAVDNTYTPPYVIFSALQDGTYDDFWDGEGFRIHYNFVSNREYDYDIRFSGNAAEYPMTDQRVRDVCTGYGADCASTPAATALAGDGTTATVTIKDYDSASQPVATTTLKLPVSGATGAMKISGLDYHYLDEGNADVPEWFIRNKWYQYVMAAYSNGESPGVSTPCTAGTNCLTLNLRDAGSTVVGARDDVRAVVMISREALGGQSWPGAEALDYFDDASNVDLTDSIFDRRPESGTYNDLIRIAVSCPSSPGQLCWSN